MNDSIDDLTEEPQARRAGALAQAVSNQIAEQEAVRDSEAAYAAADEEPAFNKRTGESNFGKRLSAKIQIATRGL